MTNIKLLCGFLKIFPKFHLNIIDFCIKFKYKKIFMIQSLKKMIPLDGGIRKTYHYMRGVLAFLLSGNPAKDMIVIGVTGTK